MISFLITASDETEELKQNLKIINIFKELNDEVIILLDQDKFNEEILEIAKKNSDRTIFKCLNFNFSEFKNFGISECKYSNIFHVDADEVLNGFLISYIRKIISNNKEISGIHIPRINLIEGASEKDLENLKFSFNEKKWINWPDYQPRFINRDSNINFVNKVHETFSDFSKNIFLEAHPAFAILHIKSLEKQIKQNKLYESIN
jgi:hypothetical protein